MLSTYHLRGLHEGLRAGAPAGLADGALVLARIEQGRSGRKIWHWDHCEARGRHRHNFQALSEISRYELCGACVARQSDIAVSREGTTLVGKDLQDLIAYTERARAYAHATQDNAQARRRTRELGWAGIGYLWSTARRAVELENEYHDNAGFGALEAKIRLNARQAVRRLDKAVEKARKNGIEALLERYAASVRARRDATEYETTTSLRFSDLVRNGSSLQQAEELCMAVAPRYDAGFVKWLSDEARDNAGNNSQRILLCVNDQAGAGAAEPEMVACLVLAGLVDLTGTYQCAPVNENVAWWLTAGQHVTYLYDCGPRIQDDDTRVYTCVVGLWQGQADGIADIARACVQEVIVPPG